ncbi:mandelate racemase/muconate lactonizing enzyme family protein [Methylobacterium oryzihabitans]|uniref:Mandelate racemase/muconate lactonizing enzyme family protein n=1 Tax=Methylobacterium oryzihabitans TaxID=2499852 RepID=A0A3S2XF64_9HYPH|nr:mandelate racemase/muconate lactonizing enzyme family protein [Methylobacterium oryzihabitans]RVU13215.1 mandelate racemase/muconate lactonizing enzyme family protein [Methylobacterium oryzihabitans]
MRVRRIRVYVVESGGLRPVILEMTTDDGTVGLGEAALAYGLGGTAAAAMIGELCERCVLGRDPFRIEAIWSEMVDQSFWAKGGGPVVFAAMSAIEQALVDIKARALGVPAYDLLGGRVHDALPAYANGWYFGCTDAADLPRFAAAAVADGYDALKAYPLATILETGRLRHPSRRGVSDGDLRRRGVAVVAALRAALGPGPSLMLDLSGGLTPDETIRFCREVEDFDIAFVEEPADPFDPQALAKIAAGISQPIAVGERVYTRYGFRDLLAGRAIDILQPDLGNTGGILEGRKIAAMAEAYGVKVQPHVCASALSTAIAMHFSAATPNIALQEHFPYWARIPGHTELLENPIEERVSGGTIPVLDAAGYGVTLRADVLGDCRRVELRAPA